MSGGYVREATESDAIILAPFLREMDCIEITAVSGKNPLEGLLDVFSAPNAKVHSIVQNDGTIMGIFGVTDCAHGSGYGVPFLLASNQLEQHSKEFLRHCKKWVKELESEYPCLYNFIHTQNLEKGYEGSIVRLDDVYKCGRSWSLRKFKDFKDAEALLCDWVEDKGKRKGTIGKFMAIDEHGVIFGMPVMDKFDYLKENFEEMKTWVGKPATFTYFEKTKAGSYRHPLFKAIRNYE